jgi:hypothetical protein
MLSINGVTMSSHAVNQLFDQNYQIQKKRKNYAGSENPTLIKEKEPLWYQVPESSTAKRKGTINGGSSVLQAWPETGS